MQNLSGILIFLSFLCTLYSYFFNSETLIIAGLLAWSSFFILFKSIKNKKILYILFSLSSIAFFISYINDFDINFTKVFTINQYLLALLIGVGFLRLIASPKKDKTSTLPIGKNLS